MEQESKGYTLIPNNIFDLDLTVQEQSLFITIISFYNKEKGYAYPSYKQLKERSKISQDRTLIKYIESLTTKNLLSKEMIKGRGNKYYIPTPISEYLQIGSTSENGGTPTPKTEEHPLRKRSTTNTNTNININTNTNFLENGELQVQENYIACKTIIQPTAKMQYLQNNSTCNNTVAPTAKMQEHLLQKCSTTNTNINTNTNTISSFDIKKLNLSKKVISEIGEDKILNIVSTLKEINKDVSDLTITKTIKDTLGIKTSSKKQNTELTDEELRMFNELWSLYPNKKGIANARKAFKKLIDKIDFEELKRCIERFNDDMKDKELKYVKQGGTFFNTGFEDYLDENYNKSSSKKQEYKPVSDNFD